jgi:hypothetical protein
MSEEGKHLPATNERVIHQSRTCEQQSEKNALESALCHAKKIKPDDIRPKLGVQPDLPLMRLSKETKLTRKMNGEQRWEESASFTLHKMPWPFAIALMAMAAAIFIVAYFGFRP